MSSQNPLWDLQRGLVGKDLVCRLELEAITPILVGGYDAKTSHRDLGAEGLRAPSEKGVWRWWARSLVSAAIYRRMGKFPGIRGADRVVSKLLGSTSHRSLYQLVVENSNFRYTDLSSEHGYYSRIARIRLLGLSERFQDRALAPGSRFVVKIYGQGSRDEPRDSFAAYSLVLALALGGVGKATSRGFGKLAVRNVRAQSRVVQEVGRKFGSLYTRRVAEKPEEAERIAKELLETGVSLAEKVLEDRQLKEGRYECPLFETPVENYYRVIASKKAFKYDSLALKAIGIASLKLYWKVHNILKTLPINAEVSGEERLKEAFEQAYSARGVEYDTWILGLPRFQEEKEEEEKEQEKLTGYLASLSAKRKSPAEIRRKSPIIFTPVRLVEGRSYYILILGFKTCDWYELEITHVSGDGTRTPIQVNIDKAFADAMSYVVNVIEEFGETYGAASR